MQNGHTPGWTGNLESAEIRPQARPALDRLKRKMTRHSPTAHEYLRAHGWSSAGESDLGTTAHVHLVEREGSRSVLKLPRSPAMVESDLRREYYVMRRLSETAMRQYMPAVGEWVEELGGFFMSAVSPGRRAQRRSMAFAQKMGEILRILHAVPLPPEGTVADDRPDVGHAVCTRLRGVFQSVTTHGGLWSGLTEADLSILQTVRSQYPAHCELLAAAESRLTRSPIALTHGDLSGDNIAELAGGELVLIDWGSTTVSAAICDIASFLTYVHWPDSVREGFLQSYQAVGGAERLGDAGLLATLLRLYRYRSCVVSLRWANDAEVGLDEVGRAHMERVVSEL